MPTVTRVDRIGRNGRTKGDVTEPTALRQLVDRVGPAETTRLIGVTTTTLYRALSQSVVSKVIEVAAAGELVKLNSTRPAPAQTTSQPLANTIPDEAELLIIEVRIKQVAKLAKIAEAFGAKVVS